MEPDLDSPAWDPPSDEDIEDVDIVVTLAKNPPPKYTMEELVGIFRLIKSVRRGDWAEDLNEAIGEMLELGFTEDQAEALLEAGGRL